MVAATPCVSKKLVSEPHQHRHELCHKRLLNKLNKKCAGADIGTLFPGDCGEALTLTDLADCLDRLVECQVCLGLNSADGLHRDCDDFDDGLGNGSCP